MARYVGPCVDCGTAVDRVIRPGRALSCVDCAIERQASHNRSMAAGTHPNLERSRAAGQATAEAIATRKGHMYEKWRDNIIRAAMAEWD